ncbi:Heat shock protein HslJ [Streptomyces sp. yr375]|uniref:META domain-containing protein n=1 Tax=Streptomyces sp. yr375 TaxID=1761906 RepID=UPI0008C38228|nr:META domain-containing protein [Streptomyces sp. yr375]SES46970.1 Heat shock protein HslJ [Streptomyces sp. yr375]
MYTYKYTKRRTRRMTLTVLAVLIPFAAACGTEQADGTRPGSGAVSAEKPVTGVRWTIDSVTVDGTTHQAPDGAHLEIDDSKAVGSYGCNTFTATAAVAADSVRFSDARSTRMACTGQPMTFERTLSAALTQGTLTTDVDGSTLTLATADGDQVHLTST